MALDEFAIITLADLKATLGITVSTYDAMLEQAINAATSQIEGYLDRKVAQRRLTEWTTCGGQPHVVVKNPPIGHVHYLATGAQACATIGSTVSTDILAAVTVRETEFCLTRMEQDGNETIVHRNFNQVPTSALLVDWINTIDGFSATLVKNCAIKHVHRFGGRDLLNSTLTLTFADTAQRDTRVDLERGIIYLAPTAFPNDYESFPRKEQTLLIDYDGGWETIPYDIEQACRLIAAGIFYSRARDTSVSSESLGDYSYSLDTRTQTDKEAFLLLQRYRRLR